MSVGAWRAGRRRHRPAGRSTTGRRDAAGRLAVLDLAVATSPWSPPGAWCSPFVLCLLGGSCRSASPASPAACRGRRRQPDRGRSRHLDLQALSIGACRTSVQWAVELMLVAFLAGYARRLFGEVREQHTLALDRMRQLTEANALLASLHRVAQTLPASLDIQRGPDAPRSPATRAWSTSTSWPCSSLDDADGAVDRRGRRGRRRCPGRIQPADLPASMAAAAAAARPRSSRQPRPARTAWARRSCPRVRPVCPAARLGAPSSGLHRPRAARARPLRHGATWRCSTDSSSRPLSPSTTPGGSRRLRTVGADEERNRIARELHDRVGQSLAFLGFELDRLAAKAEDETGPRRAAARLRDRSSRAS